MNEEKVLPSRKMPCILKRQIKEKVIKSKIKISGSGEKLHFLIPFRKAIRVLKFLSFLPNFIIVDNWGVW